MLLVASVSAAQNPPRREPPNVAQSSANAARDRKIFDDHPQFLTMVRNSRAIQAELGITDTQIREIDEKYKLGREAVAAGFKFLEQLPEEQKGAAYQQIFEDDMASHRHLIKGILTQTQMARLEQIALQQRVKTFYPAAGLTHPLLVKALEISADQQQEIRSHVEKVEAKAKARMAELQAEMAKVRDDARQETLTKLTPEQRRVYQSLIGKFFDGEPPLEKR
jgi:hypothetical protein